MRALSSSRCNRHTQLPWSRPPRRAKGIAQSTKITPFAICLVDTPPTHRAPFASNTWFKGRKTCHIATGASQTTDESGADRVSETDKDDWGGAALLRQRGPNRDRVSENDIGLRCDELFREPLRIGPGWHRDSRCGYCGLPTIRVLPDPDVALAVAGSCSHRFREPHEQADAAHEILLLSPCRHRPRCRSTYETHELTSRIAGPED